jgi:YbgC/YbaW family acyl-CoA thioester hydrolase
MRKDEFRFFHRLRVRWGETDAQQVVFFPHYLAYCNVASVAYWRALGFPYPDGLASFDGDLFLKKITLEYAGSARFDDELDVGVQFVRAGNSSLTFCFAMFRGDELLVHGELVSVFTDRTARRPKSLPAPLRVAIEDFERAYSPGCA